MADSDLSVLTPDLPAQATGANTLPGAAAEAADIAKAPSAVDVLRVANYGDEGAEQYNRLQAAGRTASNPLAVMAGMGAPGMAAPAAAPMSAGGANQPSELAVGGIARALTAFTDPKLAAQQQAQQQESIAAAAKARRESATEFFAELMPAAFKQFPGRPDLAAQFLQNSAVSRGIQVDPAVLVKLNQDIQDGQLTPAKIGEILSDPTTDVNTVLRLGTKASFISDVAKGQAESQKAVAEAMAAPGLKSQESQKKAIDIANALRTAQRPPTQNEIETLSAAGLEAYQVPVPGSPGSMMWSTRPRGGAKESGVVDPTALKQESTRNLREQQFHKSAKEKLEAEVKAGTRASFGEQDILREVEALRARAEAGKTQATKLAGQIAESRVNVQRGVGLIKSIEEAVQKYGLAEGQLEAMTTQPITMLWDRFRNDPAYSTLTAFPATLSNVARALGEKGVLTDTDLARVEAALKPRLNDTTASYGARVKFVSEAMRRAQAAVEEADKSGALVPIALNDITYSDEPRTVRPDGAVDVSTLKPGNAINTGTASPSAAPAGGRVGLQDWLNANP